MSTRQLTGLLGVSISTLLLCWPTLAVLPDAQPRDDILIQSREAHRQALAGAVERTAAFRAKALLVKRSTPIRTFADMQDTIIRTPEPERGREIMHDIYVDEIAYGLDTHGVIRLARLKGMYDDGRTVDIDNSANLEVLDGPGDFAGAQLFWGCGGENRPLLVDELHYATDHTGRVRVQVLRGTLDNGDPVHFVRPAGGRDELKCEVETVTSCIDSDDDCWGICQGIVGCSCLGFSGDCNVSIKIKCNNNSCYHPGVCRYDGWSGTCWCDGREPRPDCQTSASDVIEPGATAVCSFDGGITTASAGHARVFDLQQQTTITHVHYGVERYFDETGGGNPIEVMINIWEAPGFPSTIGAVLLDSSSDLVDSGTVNELRVVDMGGVTMGPGPIVVEIANNNGIEFFGFVPGSNTLGQSAPSYLYAPECGGPQWHDVAAMGYPDQCLLLCIDGVTGSRVPWQDNFDSYPSLTPLHGQGMWRGWDNDPLATAMVVDLSVQSPPNSAEVAGPADIVQEFVGADSGFWSFSCWQYIPADFASGGGGAGAGTYFILLNTYEDGGPHEAPDYSLQMNFDSNDGMLKVYYGNGMNTVNKPYETDRWVEIQTIVDLENDWTQIYYDDELVTEYSWTGGVFGDGGGALEIAAVDLAANGSSFVFYDDMALEEHTPPPCPADSNGDRKVNTDDFLAVLSNWGPCPPPCPPFCVGDSTGDCQVNTDDFLAVLSNWGSCPGIE